MFDINSGVIGVVVDDLAAGSALGVSPIRSWRLCWTKSSTRPGLVYTTTGTDKQLAKQLPLLRNFNAFRYHCPLHYRAGIGSIESATVYPILTVLTDGDFRKLFGVVSLGAGSASPPIS